jgi:hypothetical protein
MARTHQTPSANTSGLWRPESQHIAPLDAKGLIGNTIGVLSM